MTSSMKLDRRPKGEDGLELLLARFKPRARAITASYRIPAEDGEDLLQEALLTFLHKRAEIYNPEAWLAAALRRRCLMYWRARRHSLLLQVDTSVLELMAQGGQTSQESVDLRLDLNRALCRLSDRCRSLLVARYRQGLSPSEAARSLGYRASGVYKLLERCLTAITRRLTLAGGKRV